MCNTCTAKRIPPKPVEGKPHTYSHDLLRCHEKEEDKTERSADERVATTITELDHKVSAIEQQVSAIDSMLDNKLGPVDERVVTLDQKVDSLTDRLSRLEGFMERMLTQLTTQDT